MSKSIRSFRTNKQKEKERWKKMRRLKIPANNLNPDTDKIIDCFANAYTDQSYTVTLHTDEGTVGFVPHSLAYESSEPGMFLCMGEVTINGRTHKTRGFYDGNNQKGYLDIE